MAAEKVASQEVATKMAAKLPVFVNRCYPGLSIMSS